MRTIIGYVQKYLVYASPIVLATILWSTQRENIDFHVRQSSGVFIKFLWEIMSWTLIVWFVLLLIYSVLLIFHKPTQESTVKFVAGLKERDEREEIIMGLAAKRAFTSTSCLLIFLLFLSCLTVTVAHLPPEQVIDGKKSSLNIGFEFSGVEPKTTTSEDGRVVFKHHDLPLSKSAILLIVLIWQVGNFRWRARKELQVA